MPQKPSLSRIVREALRYLGSVRNYAPTTLDGYETSFEQFRSFLLARQLPDDIHHFTGDTVRRFAEDLAERGSKASTIVIRLTALSSIANTLMKLNDGRGRPYLAQNPTKAFEWPTVDRPETKFLLPDELGAFLRVSRPVRESIARDLLVDTGLRVSELCRANVGSVITVDGKTALALTVKGRGRRERKRHVPISAAVASTLSDYLAAREILNPQDPKRRDEPLLLNREGLRWKRTSLSALMARIGREAGIDRLRVSAHKLRHTANVVTRFARREDGSSLDRWTRSRLLSHENPQSLDRYEHLLPDELFEARAAQRQALNRYLGGSGDRQPAPARGLDTGMQLLLAKLEALERRVEALTNGGARVSLSG